MADAGPFTSTRSARGRRHSLYRLACGLAVLAAILWGQSLFGALTRQSRIDPALIGSERVNVVVVLDFDPERFHNERLAALGMFSGRDRSPRRVRLRNVTPDQLRALGSLAWVSRVVPMT